MLCLLAIISFKNYQQGKFYYAFSNKKPLVAHGTKLAVRFTGAQPQAALRSRLGTLNVSQDRQKWQDGRTVIINAADETQQQDILRRFGADPDVVAASPLYLIDQKQEAVLTDEFMVQFADNANATFIDSLNKAYGVTVIKHSLYYLLRVPVRADVLAIANAYYETGRAKFSHPNFLMQIELLQHIPNDPYFGSQFNFHNTGQVINTIDNHTGTAGADIKGPEAWSITQGSAAITVAVIDEGVTANHPDIPAARQVLIAGDNFVPGENANDPAPHGVADNHGNACAGLVGATMDNGIGITGLAPSCTIMPIKITDDNENFVSTDLLASAIEFAANNNAAVISNSWGMNGTTDPNAVPAIVADIQYAVTSGRGGKGSVVCFAAGNTAAHNSGNNGYVEFPANVNITGVLTVGASDRYDHQADYSPTSNPSSTQNQMIDVVAPSHRAYPLAYGGIAGETLEVWSIDIPTLALGYNSWPASAPPYVTVGETLPNAGTDYDAFTGRFGGTSAACPQVAGLAALILSINPNLTAVQVYNIITSTADKTGGYTYNSSGFSNELGYGRVDACKAVIQAISTSAISGPACYTTGTVDTYTIPNVLPSTSVTWSVSPNFTIVSGQGTPTVQVEATSSPNAAASITANVTSACGASTTLSKIIGLPILSGGYINTFDGSNNPLGYYPEITNPACTGYYINTAVGGANFTSITWSKVSSSGVVNWSQSGNNISFYLFATGEWAIFQAVISNGCGSLTYQFKWQASACGGGGGCNAAAFALSPNPATNHLTVMPDVTGPCNVATGVDPSMAADAASDSSLDAIPIRGPRPANTPRLPKMIKALRIYDVSGRLVRSFSYGSGVTSLQNVDISNLSPGIYFVEITDYKAAQRTQLLITR